MLPWLGQGEHGKAAEPEDSDEEAALSEDEEDEDPPQLHICKLAHHGGINRVRAMPQQPAVIATWGDTALLQVVPAPQPPCMLPSTIAFAPCTLHVGVLSTGCRSCFEHC